MVLLDLSLGHVSACDFPSALQFGVTVADVQSVATSSANIARTSF